MTDLAVIVVAFHNADLLKRCLSSLPGDLPVWVVDNSSDMGVEAVAKAHRARYVDTGSNLGFAGGVNIGLRLVAEQHDVLLLNPDAEVSADSLSKLHSFLHIAGNDRLAAVSPTLLDPETLSKQRVAWPLPTPGRMWREALGLSRLSPPRDEYVIGAVLLLRREAISDVGVFDERFFLYAEEADWQRRAISKGWHAAELPGVTALHEGAGTSTDVMRREVLFHAGTETYLRKWFGPSGWTSYRIAAALGAGVRGLLLRGTQGQAARARAALYGRGPMKVAGLPPRPSAVGRRIAHVVVTNAFAGVERYVCEVAREQAARGAAVTVIGGEPSRMSTELGAARYVPAATVPAAARQLARLGRQDVVHTHMTAAELAAVMASPSHGAPIVSTRHFAGPRGSTTLARVLGRLVGSRIERQVAISRFVAEAIPEPTVVIPNGVRSQQTSTGPRNRVVLCLNRLEKEKATDVAVRAWAASGVAQDGWQLHVAGAGAERPHLEALTSSLGIDDSVRFLGQVTDTATHLRGAAMLLATATAEPFGLSVVEAMAHGTPVLASDGGAHPELLGEGGWIFPSGDHDAAATQLRRITSLTDTDRKAEGSRLRQRQQALFDLDMHVIALDGMYTQVLAPNRGARGSDCGEERDAHLRVGSR